MSEELFDVVFFGILQAGKDKEVVMQNMATLFKTDAAKLAPFFAGGRKVIKGNINTAAAEKYKVALENIGLTIKLEACAASAQSETPKATGTSTPTKTEKNNPPEIDTAGLSMAAAGSDVIENPVEVPAQKIDDISDISMAEAGVNVIENPAEVPAQKIDDISGISMAEVGTDVLDHTQQVTAQKIDDISDISLAEAGADMIENPKPKEKAIIPDTSELALDD